MFFRFGGRLALKCDIGSARASYRRILRWFNARALETLNQSDSVFVSFH